MSDRVSKMFWSASAKSLRSMKVFIEVYIDNRSVFVIVYMEQHIFDIFIDYRGQNLRVIEI
jgi:hypothetical protein